MKNSDKIIVALLFIGLNAGALYFISKFYNVGYGILFVSFVSLVASIDIHKRLKNHKINKQLRKQQEAQQKVLNDRRKFSKEEIEQRRVQAVRNQQSRQARMREHNSYNKGRKKK